MLIAPGVCSFAGKSFLKMGAAQLSTGLQRRMPNEFMNTRQLAEYLGVSKIKLVSDRARGVGPPFVRLDGRSIRYERAAIDLWVKGRTIQPGQQPKKTT